MKCLIVDDERSVRDALHMMGQWDALNVTEVMEAENGHQAWALIEQERPDVVITDMKMDAMDGVALLQRIEAMENPPQVLVISGFSDFAMMHSAISAGAVDYLLKPIGMEQFNDSVKRALERCAPPSEGEKQRGYIHNAMAGEMAAYPAVGDFLRGHGDCVLFGLCMLSFNRVCAQRFSGTPDLLYFTVHRALEEEAGRDMPVLILRLLGGGVGTLNGLAALTDAYPTPEAIHQRLTHVLTKVAQTYGLPMLLKTGQPFRGLDGLKDALEQVNRGLEDTPADGSRSVCGNVTEDRPHIHLLKGEAEERLTRALYGEEAEAADLLADQLESLRAQDALTFHNADYLLSRLCRILSGRLAAQGAPDSTPEGMDYEKLRLRLHDALGDREALTALFRTFLSPFMQQLAEGADRLASQLRRYVDEHYAEKLSLSELSERFFISREHASRCFRRDTGVTFVQYVTDVRLAHVCERLLNTDQALADIAEAAGFAESSYLIRVFQKKYGMTPGDYRRTGHAKEDSLC